MFNVFTVSAYFKTRHCPKKKMNIENRSCLWAVKTLAEKSCDEENLMLVVILMKLGTFVSWSNGSSVL